MPGPIKRLPMHPQTSPLANETRETVALKIRLCLLRVRLERERVQRFLRRARLERAARGKAHV